MEHCEDEEDEEIVLAAKNGGEDDEDEEVYELSRTPSPIDMNDDTPMMRKTSQPPASLDPLARSPSPDRKDSRGSHGSSSYDEERASSLSPEPTKTIQTPSSAVQSPMSPPHSSNSKNALTKIYTAALGDSD